MEDISLMTDEELAENGAIFMSDATIEYVRGLSDDLGYKVGLDGVTRIEQGQYSPEPYCSRIFYQIYKGDKLHAVVNDYAVAEIVFS